MASSRRGEQTTNPVVLLDFAAYSDTVLAGRHRPVMGLKEQGGLPQDVALKESRVSNPRMPGGEVVVGGCQQKEDCATTTLNYEIKA